MRTTSHPENLASEAHDIGSVWDAVVGYLLTGSDESKQAAAKSAADWRQRHPAQLVEMEEC